MNAYELADIVDRWAYKESAEYLTDAANMLRQQADRIAELENALSRYELRDLEHTTHIATLENQLDKCSHHEAMAHQGYMERIAELSKNVDELEEELLKAPQTNAKPVAWIGNNELQFGFTDTRVTNEKESWDDIPLYTTPQTKPLSDEEIIAVFESPFHPQTTGRINDEVIAFARAIEERHGIK